MFAVAGNRDYPRADGDTDAPPERNPPHDRPAPTSTTGTDLRVVDGVQLPAAGTYVLDPTHTRIGFVARHLMVTKVRGQFARVRPASITIGAGPRVLDRRGHHADRVASRPASPTATTTCARGDFLEVEKYPTITFANAQVVASKGTDFKVVGDLTIKGVTKQVTLDVELDGVAKDPWGNEQARRHGQHRDRPRGLRA